MERTIAARLTDRYRPLPTGILLSNLSPTLFCTVKRAQDLRRETSAFLDLPSAPSLGMKGSDKITGQWAYPLTLALQLGLSRFSWISGTGCECTFH